MHNGIESLSFYLHHPRPFINSLLSLLLLLSLSSAIDNTCAAAASSSSAGNKINNNNNNNNMSSSYPKLKLTYFDIEGVAESIRLAFEIAKIPYEDQRIKFPEWGEMKPTTPYGQVPLLYVDDDEKPKTQSGAILRYAATLNPSAKLYPSEKMYEIEEAIGLLGDMQRAWSPAIYMGMKPQNYGYAEGFNTTPEGQEVVKQMRATFVAEEMPKYLKYIADYIDAHGGGKFLCGDHPTIADCIAVPQLRTFTRGHVDHVPTNCLEIEPRIIEYIKRFCAVEGVKGRYVSGVY